MVVDPVALAFNFSPFGSKHQNEETSGLTSLPHQNSKCRAYAMKIQGSLEQSTLIPCMEWKILSCPNPPFPFQSSFDTPSTQLKQKH
jgi:hypothetical protein